MIKTKMENTVLVQNKYWNETNPHLKICISDACVVHLLVRFF